MSVTCESWKVPSNHPQGFFFFTAHELKPEQDTWMNEWMSGCFLNDICFFFDLQAGWGLCHADDVKHKNIQKTQI